MAKNNLKNEKTDVTLSNYPNKIIIVLWSLILLFLGLNAYIWFDFLWYTALIYFGYAFIILAIFVLVYCRKCYYYGRKCPFWLGRAISTFHIRGKIQQKRMPRPKFHNAAMLFLTLPTVALAVYEIIAVKKTSTDMLTLTLFIVFALLSGFVIFNKTRKEIACRYCFNRTQCYNDLAPFEN